MYTHQVSRERWKSVFDSLSRAYEGSTASLEVLDDDRGAQMEIEEQPLRGISYDASGIELIFATRDGGHFAHRISDPLRVEIEEGNDGLVDAIGIVSASEPQTILRLHAPVSSKLLPRATD